MSDKGVLQLVQSDFTRYENYSTRLQGKYKLCICDISVLHPAGGNTDVAFQLDIQQLQGVLDNRNRIFCIQKHTGAPVITNKIDFGEVFINGQFTFSGLNMSTLSSLIITLEYEKV